MSVNNISHIQDSPRIRAILDLISYDSCLVLDIDNTVIEPSNFVVGSDQWFDKLTERATQIIPDKNEAVGYVISIYSEVQKYLHMQPVEQSIVAIVKALQKIGIPVIALTSRSDDLRQETLRQLDEVGVNLHDKIIFCANRSKGDCLKEYLLTCNKKLSHIVMVDDKEKHLIHVKNAVASLGLRFDGVRYGYLDEKVKNTDMNQARTELGQFHHVFSSTTELTACKLGLFSRQNSFSQDYQYISSSSLEKISRH